MSDKNSISMDDVKRACEICDFEVVEFLHEVNSYYHTKEQRLEAAERGECLDQSSRLTLCNLLTFARQIEKMVKSRNF